MNEAAFIVASTSLYPLTAKEVKIYLEETPKKQLVDLRVFDLAIISNQPFMSAGGIYIFFDCNNNCLYVGKATSRSFIERIPAHFDPRSGAWFATFPNRVLSHKLATDYFSALQFCLDCSLLLIQFPSNEDCRQYASNLEGYLRSLLLPKLNLPKRLKVLQDNQIVSDYLQVSSTNQEQS